MKKISIRRPTEVDVDELSNLFSVTISDAFDREGNASQLDEIKKEIAEKKQFLLEDLNSNGIERFFLLACCNEKIVGTISYGYCNNLIIECSEGKLKDIGEIGSAYILPKYQNIGIGTLLLNSIITTLISRNIKEFCLDSGYTNAQKVWTKKLGKPSITMKDYWGNGFDYLIWHRRLEDTKIIYSI